MRACSDPILRLYVVIWLVRTRSVPLRLPILPCVAWIFFWTSPSFPRGEDAPSEDSGSSAQRASGSATVAISTLNLIAARDASDPRGVVWQDLFHAASHVVRS